jgi:hypothetical protein
VSELTPAFGARMLPRGMTLLDVAKDDGYRGTFEIAIEAT